MRAVRWEFKCAAVALAAMVAACSDGGGSGSSGVTSVTSTVIDGAIYKALVWLDKNRNGQCDVDEPQGKTDINGKVTLIVASADLNNFPIIALVRPDTSPGANDGAVDADIGKVLVPYTLSAPAGKTSVLSPLTTLVQQAIADTGASTADATKTVQEVTGISVSPFDDFTLPTVAPTGDSVSAATVARMLVLTTQQQWSRIASTFIDGAAISQPSLDKVIQNMSDMPNEWWDNRTLGIDTLGTVALNTGTAPGYFSGNTKLRIAFKGSGTNPVTYYACKERFTNGSSRNCLSIGTGSYSIATLGDARVLTLNNLPVQTSSLNYKTVFVERGGLIYSGYQSKPNVNNGARLNTVAATALLAQLGLPAVNPEVPLALTAGSYQGVWDAHDPAVTDGDGTVVSIRANASVLCQDRPTGFPRPCTLTFTNLSTGAFTLTNGALTAVGTFDVLTGIGSGTYSNPKSTPASGSVIARRR